YSAQSRITIIAQPMATMIAACISHFVRRRWGGPVTASVTRITANAGIKQSAENLEPSARASVNVQAAPAFQPGARRKRQKAYAASVVKHAVPRSFVARCPCARMFG